MRPYRTEQPRPKIYIGNNPHDKIAVTFSLVGSPVHLVQLG